MANPNGTAVGRLDGNCIHCGVSMAAFLGSVTPAGPIHNDCIPAYKRKSIERCAHCDNVLKESRSIFNGKKMHPECVADFKAGKPYEPPAMQGMLSKFAVGRSFFGKKNWKERFFVLSKASGLAYYETEAEFKDGKPPKGAVTLSSDVRLITHPHRLIHKEAMNPSTELILAFTEGKEDRRLLVAAKTYQEHDEWVRCLECYIKTIDDPKDLQE